MKPINENPEGFDNEIKPFIISQVSHGKNCSSIRQTQLPPRLLLWHRVELFWVHSVWNTRYLFFRNPQLNHRFFQCFTDCDNPSRPAKNIPKKLPDQRKRFKQIDITASCRNHDRLFKNPSEQDGGKPIGIDVMSVDQVKIEVFLNSPHRRKHG